MAAVAMDGPWVLILAVTHGERNLNVPALLSALAATIFVLAVLMQTLLVAWVSADLKPARPNWTFNLASAARRFGADLVLNLMSLALTAAGMAVFGGILAFISAAGVGIFDAITHRSFNTSDAEAFGGVAAAFAIGALVSVVLLSRWSVALPVVHLEGLGPADALRRSATITTGQRWRISIIQAVHLAIWLAGVIGFVYAVAELRLNETELDGIVIALFAILGLSTALEALAKVRLYRELATVEGAVGASTLADVFE
ncbi:MAG: hypothetical protein JSR86_12285 [Proteobacteria bacterium]|nr:hypothetical protein [Pseudomonadota bacterium]